MSAIQLAELLPEMQVSGEEPVLTANLSHYTTGGERSGWSLLVSPFSDFQNGKANNVMGSGGKAVTSNPDLADENDAHKAEAEAEIQAAAQTAAVNYAQGYEEGKRIGFEEGQKAGATAQLEAFSEEFRADLARQANALLAEKFDVMEQKLQQHCAELLLPLIIESRKQQMVQEFVALAMGMAQELRPKTGQFTAPPDWTDHVTRSFHAQSLQVELLDSLDDEFAFRLDTAHIETQFAAWQRHFIASSGIDFSINGKEEIPKLRDIWAHMSHEEPAITPLSPNRNLQQANQSRAEDAINQEASQDGPAA